MNIDLKQLRKQEGEEFTLQGKVEVETGVLTDRVPTAPMSYDISYFLTDNKLFFSGKGEINSSSNCYRCGKSVQLKEGIKFLDVVDLSENEYQIKDEKFPLEKFLLDKMILSQGTTVLCKKSCKGLCGICGADLNVAKCACDSTHEEDNPFYALKKSIGDDKLK